jgi:hypothetical protein
MKKVATSILTAGLCAVTALASTAASAVDAPRNEVFGAAGLCTPALDNTFKGLRARASGIRNEGTATMYLACSAPGDWRTGTAYDGAQHLSMRVANFGAASIVIKCTLRPGYTVGASTNLTQGAFPKSITLAPSGYGWIDWYAATLLPAGEEFANANFGCELPPGGEVQYMWREYAEDVGA